VRGHAGGQWRENTGKSEGLSFALSCGVSAPRLTLALFLVAQVFDGIFTYVAVGAHGAAVEGNAILATWITLVGPAAALLGAKAAASLCGVLLYNRGVHRGLMILTALYLLAAIGPWLLFFRGELL
jgi:hypothetical protein